MNLSQQTIQMGLSNHIIGNPVEAQIREDSLQDVTERNFDTGCLLFEFVLNFILTGILCVIAFIGNTLAFLTLWHERQNSPIIFLLQAIIIADIAVTWVIFVEDVIPGLGYVIPLLGNCHQVCPKLLVVTNPLLVLAQSCVLWLTVCAAINCYFILTGPINTSSTGTLEFARKQVILVLACSLILILPLTVDTSIKVAHVDLDAGTPYAENLRENKMYKKIYSYGVLSVIVLLIPWGITLYMGIKLGKIMTAVKKLRRAFGNWNRVQTKESAQVILTLCITAFICYAPAIIHSVVKWTHPNAPTFCGHLNYYLDHFCKMFMTLNSSFKILILCLFHPHFLRSLKDTFCHHKYCTVKPKNMGHSGLSNFRGYRCQDMSEMTLMSHIEDQVDYSRI